ncbi:helix-turn-helix domain-containing protein, partial [Pseudomonas lundensis]|nr:helix-turn-helix domain-containing protein [Pseudomonas lundensis]NNA28274.1 helix-turn-helix domain-containing protein [Pseudomonas lundensis]
MYFTENRISWVYVQSLGRHPSTISREIKRNPQQPHYDAIQATSRAQQLRHAPRRQRR